MRASLLVIMAVLIAAFFAFYDYEYDGHYRKTVIDQIDHEAENLFAK